MGRKKKQTVNPLEHTEYTYSDSLSVRVKEINKNENAGLQNYFGELLRSGEVIDRNHKYCSICLESHVIKRYKNTTSTGNLRTHLREKHEVNLEHKLTERNQQKVTSMLLSVGKDKEASVVIDSSTEKRYILARQICLWFCRDLLAFNTANRDGIHDFFVYAGLIKNDEKLPDRTTIADSALNDIYDALMSYIKKFSDSSLPKTLTTSMDFWTDNVKRVSYINYWLHWMDTEFTMQKLCLGIKRFPHPHTAELIAAAFKLVVEEFKLNNKNLLAVTDNGTNIVKACQLLDLEREPCLCHNFHLLVSTDLIKDHRALEPIRILIIRMKTIKKALIYKSEELQQINDKEHNSRVYELVSSLRNISDILECNEVLITEFDEINEENQLLVQFCNEQVRRSTNYTTLKNSNVTRWNSVLTMFNSFIKNVDNINNCLASIKRYDLALSETEITLAIDFVKVLHVFGKSTDLLQGDSYPSQNLALFCYVDIKASLKELSACRTSSSLIKTSADYLLERLDYRFPITENMIVASFLDPSMQDLDIISTYCRLNYVNMVDLLIKKWAQYKPELKEQKSAKNVPVVRKLSLVGELRMELIKKHIGNESNSEGGFEAKIQQEYLKYTAVSDDVDDPLAWWRSHEGAFPYLSALARVMLSIPCSSGATETHFSQSGYLITKKKANLDPLTAEKIMFVHDNFKHISSSITV